MIGDRVLSLKNGGAGAVHGNTEARLFPAGVEQQPLAAHTGEIVRHVLHGNIRQVFHSLAIRPRSMTVRPGSQKRAGQIVPLAAPRHGVGEKQLIRLGFFNQRFHAAVSIQRPRRMAEG